MPEVAVIEVCDWLVKNTPELRMITAAPEALCSSGLQLASRYVDDPENTLVLDYLTEPIMIKNPWLAQPFVQVLVLDKWTCNADGRQAVFSKKSYSPHFSVTLIDQGFCFNAGEWSFPDAALRGVFFRNFVYEQVTGWDSFEPVLSRAEQMTGQELWNLAHGVPNEWWNRNSGQQIQWSSPLTLQEWTNRYHTDLGRLIDTLLQRRSKIRNLITDFRESSRNPFPRWSATSRPGSILKFPKPNQQGRDFARLSHPPARWSNLALSSALSNFAWHPSSVLSKLLPQDCNCPHCSRT